MRLPGETRREGRGERGSESKRGRKGGREKEGERVEGREREGEQEGRREKAKTEHLLSVGGLEMKFSS